MGDLTRQIGDTPVNAIAVAFLHNKRNDIYVDLGNTCVGVVKIIKDCITQKMNEEDRLKLVLSIRPKLKSKSITNCSYLSNLSNTPIWGLFGMR